MLRTGRTFSFWRGSNKSDFWRFVFQVKSCDVRQTETDIDYILIRLSYAISVNHKVVLMLSFLGDRSNSTSRCYVAGSESA